MQVAIGSATEVCYSSCYVETCQLHTSHCRKSLDRLFLAKDSNERTLSRSSTGSSIIEKSPSTSMVLFGCPGPFTTASFLWTRGLNFGTVFKWASRLFIKAGSSFAGASPILRVEIILEGCALCAMPAFKVQIRGRYVRVSYCLQCASADVETGNGNASII